MEKDEIESRIIELFQDVFDLEDVQIDATFQQKDSEVWDSIGHVRLMVAIEQEFDVEIPIETAIELNDIQSISAYLLQRTG